MNYRSPLRAADGSETNPTGGRTPDAETVPSGEQSSSGPSNHDGETTGRGASTGGSLRAELHLRGDARGGALVREIVSRAERLETTGVLDAVTVAGEWSCVHVRGDGPCSATIATYEAFREWAETNRLSLEPGFQERTRGFIGTDESEAVVVFPVIALAIYEGRDLSAVFPCTDGERTYTVEESIAAFERGDTIWFARFGSEPPADAGPVLESDGATAG